MNSWHKQAEGDRGTSSDQPVALQLMINSTCVPQMMDNTIQEEGKQNAAAGSILPALQALKVGLLFLITSISRELQRDWSSEEIFLRRPTGSYVCDTAASHCSITSVCECLLLTKFTNWAWIGKS